MANFGVMYGPANTELLWLGQDHKACAVFHSDDAVFVETDLDIRRSDKNLWRIIEEQPIPLNVMNIIRATGLGGVFDCGYRALDHSLITALIERWCPETHTFHLPFGEATVTLQDVHIMWGLQPSGYPVTGKEMRWKECAVPLCRNLLGVEPDTANFKGGLLRYSFLTNVLEHNPLPDDVSDVEVCQKRARMYILLLFGGVLFADMSDGFVQISFLTLIEYLDSCCLYSWGSAVLACLYRNLCKAATPTATTIAGPLMLLQLWAWSRLPFTSPIQPPFEFPPSYRITQPYGFRWKCPLQWRDTARHSVSVYRDRLQALHESEFIWTPYDVVSQHLPVKSVNDCLEWLCDTVVIFWEIV